MTALPAQPSYEHLLFPTLRSLRNAYYRGTRLDRFKVYFFGALTILFWLGLLLGAALLLGRLAAEQPFGELLVRKLLGFLFMIFFAVLTFSNIVASLTNLYLADDLHLFVSAPVAVDRLFLARAMQAGVQSGWMVILFALPIWLAAGLVFDSPMWFYPWMALVMAIFIILPSALGALATTLLVKAFPARKMQDVMIILSIVLVIAVYFLVRFLRPEQLFNPDLFHGFAEYFATLRAPNSPLMPSVWATEALWGGLVGKLDRRILLMTAYGLFSGLAALALAAWAAERWYLEAFSKAQEGRRARLTAAGRANRFFEALALSRRPMRRQFIIKDLKAFFRDTTQWTQLLLLLALCVVYLFNFKVLPLERFGLTFEQRAVISFVNMGLAGFVLSAVCVRFVLPAASVEGRAFWILRAAPVRMRDLLLAKYAMNVVPMVLVGQALAVVSNYFLRSHSILTIFSAVLMFFISLTITALAIGIGAIMPSFHERNIARMATGASSIVFMLTAMILIVIEITLAYVPGKDILLAVVGHRPLTSAEKIETLIAAGIGLVLFAGAAVIPFRWGVRALEQYEP